MLKAHNNFQIFKHIGYLKYYCMFYSEFLKLIIIILSGNLERVLLAVEKYYTRLKKCTKSLCIRGYN